MKPMKKSKTSLSIEDVKHVTDLAKLKLSEEEIKKFQKQLSAIVEFISKLNEIDTKNVEPTGQVTGLENVFREDEVKPSLTQEEAMSNAPSTHNGYFKVKAIFDGQ